MITLYGFSRVTAFAHGRTRDLRVLWALEEMGLPYEIKGMDHPTHTLNTEAYRAMSPFEQIPALDDDGFVMSESAAIVLYLAQKYKKLIPLDAAGQAQVMRWCFAAVNTVELPMVFIDVLKIAEGKKRPVDALREDIYQLAHTRLVSLERWLNGRQYVADNEFTVADILMAHVVSEIDDEALFDPYPRVCAYRERCMSRPAWQQTIDAYCQRVRPA